MIKLNDGGQSGFFVCNAPSTAVIAGYGSGKTYAVWLKIFNWMNEQPTVSHGYFAPTYSLIRDIFIPEAEEFCAANGLTCAFVKSESKFYVQGYAPVFCRSMNDPSTIVGFKIGNAAVDEIDLLAKKKAWLVWRRIKARCRVKLFIRGKKRKKKNRVINQMALASTPEGFKFAYEAFKKDPIEGSRLYKMTTYENARNLPDNYIDELKANYPPQLVKAYIMGEFAPLSTGVVYPSFDRDLNNAPGVSPLKRELIHIGMDFNVRKMAGIIHVERNSKPIACGEIVNVIDTPEMIRSIKEIYPKNPVIVYPDPSGKNPDTRDASKTDIRLLKDAGFMVNVRNSHPAIKDRVASVNGMICNANDERRYLINVERCPVYVTNLEQQAYTDAGLPDKDSDTDHTNDAAGYYIETNFGITKPVSSSRKLIM